MRIGLTFDEYADLRLRPPAEADPAFEAAAEMEREQLFPMTPEAASSHLRTRGYDCRPPMPVQLPLTDHLAQRRGVQQAAQFAGPKLAGINRHPFLQTRGRAPATPRSARG